MAGQELEVEAAFQQKVKERMRAGIADLLPEGVLDKMIEAAIHDITKEDWFRNAIRDQFKNMIQ